MNSIQLSATAHKLADHAGQAILPYFRNGAAIENKAAEGRFDPVTEADKAAEAAIRTSILSHYPDHDILGEELGTHSSRTGKTARFRWVLDPIDGTRAFILGLPTWGTLIGVEELGIPIVGLMDQPYTRERFWSDGKASYFRGPGGEVKRLKTRRTALANAQLSSTAPELFSDGFEKSAFAALCARARSVRYGGDCYAYCLLAAGHIDIVMEAGLKPYDIVALIPIIEHAGGVITNWNGGPASGGGQIIACGDPDVHREALQIISTVTPNML
ncbi:MAG TPA: histidinol-phosphatase [Hyphomicrobiaceae bacterium]|nr:histidinol-phosphatase [Hyphomicrobiaceae bacterium]